MWEGIRVENISKSYGKHKVLSNFSYCFRENTVTCIMGKSGCGKTTLLRMLMGLETIDSGSVKGLEQKRTSVVFQEDRLCEKFTVLENVMLVCKEKDRKNQAVALLDRFGLGGCENKEVMELSGGMKRRVAIARALMIPFDVLFLDEAWKGLDAKTKKHAIRVVKDYCKEKTVISVTHDEKEVEMMGGILLEM